MPRRTIALWTIIGISVVLAIYIRVKTTAPPPHEYDAFAQCIAHTSTTFYGAFWCPHCHEQKNEFGDAAQYLPYVECSTPDAASETQACADQGVKGYPTWQFPDGSRLEGVVTVEKLSEKTGCALPTST